jgi:hypothetical protein
MVTTTIIATTHNTPAPANQEDADAVALSKTFRRETPRT